MSRISKDAYAIEMALVAAKRSEDPHMKVGAVAMTSTGRIVAAAYNGVAPGRVMTPDFWADRDAKSRFMIHAEMNLCSLFQYGEVATVAVTHSPCAACARILVAHGVRRVLFHTLYDRDPEALQVLDFHHVEWHHI